MSTPATARNPPAVLPQVAGSPANTATAYPRAGMAAVTIPARLAGVWAAPYVHKSSVPPEPTTPRYSVAATALGPAGSPACPEAVSHTSHGIRKIRPHKAVAAASTTASESE